MTLETNAHKPDKNEENIKIVFMGTPEFALKVLETVYGAGYSIPLVLTQADKPRGRGQNLCPSPVKAFASEHSIEVYTPDRLKNEETMEMLKKADPDVILVAAYGKILPECVLELPRYGCINIHASLLPKYRGAAPINRTIQNGETEGGITVMYMAKELDAGDIILQKKVKIPEDMTAGEYHDALASLGGECALEYLELLKSGNVPRTVQDHSLATYAEKIDKSELEVNFESDAKTVSDFIRAMSPYPGAFTERGGKRIKLIRSHVSDGSGAPGEVLSYGRSGLEIACRSGSVVITSLQPQGKRIMTIDEYYAGNKNF